MSAFGIFALILTTAYIIYFAVIIIRDIANDRKNPEGASNVEIFDVTSFAQEEAMEIRKTDGGFAVGENETASISTIAHDPETPDSTDGTSIGMEEKLKELKERMTESESDVEMELSFEDEDFRNALINDDKGNGTSHLVKRRVSAAERSSDSLAGNATVRDNI